MAHRGGIFMSCAKTKLKPEKHRLITTLYRTCKIHADKVVRVLEELMAEDLVNEIEQQAYGRALGWWERSYKSKKLWMVPGIVYKGDEEEMSEEEKERVRLTMILLEETVKKLARELDAEDRKAGRFTRPDLDMAQPPLSQVMESVSPSTMEGVAPVHSTLKRKAPLSSPPATSSLPNTSLPLRSILKHKSPSSDPSPTASPDSSRPIKRLRMTVRAIMSPRNLEFTNPSPFHLVPDSQRRTTYMLHHAITTAENKRPKCFWWRKSAWYKRGQ